MTLQTYLTKTFTALCFIFIASGISASNISYTSLGNKSYSFSHYRAYSAKKFMWNFGDGTKDSIHNLPTHAYSSTGLYTVSFWVQDSSGTGNYNDTICVTGIKMTYSSYYNGYENKFQFRAKYPQSGLTYAWHSPDSLIGTDTLIYYLYSHSGSYQPRLVITEPNSGCTEVLSTTVWVKCNFTASLFVDSAVIKSGDSAHFTIKLPPGFSNMNYKLSASDTSFATGLFSGTTKSVSHRFYSKTTTRYITILADVSDVHCRDFASLLLTISPKDSTAPPDPDSCKAYMSAYHNYLDNKTWHFIATTKKAPITYTWHFGDGSTSSASAPIYTYKMLGYYNTYVTLNYSGACPADTLISSILVNCNAHFDVSRDSSNQFSGIITDRSSVDSIARYHWDFGDGDTSMAKTPVHTYAGQGPYVLCLSIHDGSCSSSYCDTIGFDTTGNLNLSTVPFSIKVVSSGSTHTQGITTVETDRPEVLAYPNPVQDVLYIALNGTETNRITVYSMDGRMVTNMVPDKVYITISCQDWPSGVYMIKTCLPDGKSNTQKIIKY